MANEANSSQNLDALIAETAREITPEEVEQARATAKSLDENPVAFGPVVMFALDRD